MKFILYLIIGARSISVDGLTEEQCYRDARQWNGLGMIAVCQPETRRG